MPEIDGRQVDKDYRRQLLLAMGTHFTLYERSAAFHAYTHQVARWLPELEQRLSPEQVQVLREILPILTDLAAEQVERQTARERQTLKAARLAHEGERAQ